MENNNPYQAPVASVELNNSAVGEVCTIEEALSRGYDFSVSEIISKAWSGVRGVKLSFLLGMIFVGIISIILQLIIVFVAAALGSITLSFILSNLVTVVCSTFLAGFAVIALRQSRAQSKGFLDDFFHMFNRFGALFLANLAVSLLMTVMFLLLGFIFGVSIMGGVGITDFPAIMNRLASIILIGGILAIFIQTSFCMIYYVIIDHSNVSAIQALAASAKLVWQHFWKILGVFCLVLIISFAVAIVTAIVVGIVAVLLSIIPALAYLVSLVLYLVAITFLLGFYYLAIANIYNAMFLK